MSFKWLAAFILGLSLTVAEVPTEEQLTSFLFGEFEEAASKACNIFNKAQWDYNTDVSNPETLKALQKETATFSAFEKEQWLKWFKGLKWETFKNETVKRQIRKLAVLGVAALEPDDLAKLKQLENVMTGVYSTAKVCPFKKPSCDITKDGLPLDPDLEKIMASSRDYNELLHVWKGWRDATGAKMKNDYQSYVELSNQAAKLNGFADMGEMWRDDYEDENLRATVQRLWTELEPLYLKIHRYTLRKLKALYGDQLDDSEGLIPAHLLGNMWGQQWDNLESILRPYPNASAVDVTKALKEQEYDIRKIFVTSDEFYQSLGLPSSEVSYGKNSVIEKPKDRDIVCHASAWDFCDRTDFRIKMCTSINMDDFITVHHEMGHIMYFILYKDQPYALRTGANPGFHEAVGDTIALSVATPKHLRAIGLLKDYVDSPESEVNALMLTAIQKIVFLPFALALDTWRWDVFSGKVQPNEWNDHWWKLRKELQRLKAPVSRSTDDFDPGSKFHVPANSQYIAYFVAHVLQFQFHKALCIAAGEYDPTGNQPLHKCDIYKSTAAGELMKGGLSLGAAKHWSDVLEIMTTERQLSSSAILEYFKPLSDFLDSEEAKLSQGVKKQDLPVNSGVERESQAQPLSKDDTTEGKPPTDSTIPIAVGSVLAVFVIVVIVAFVIGRRRRSAAAGGI
ncbi:angiotensin-converting enzyme-like [Ischnura elegans]|uniref:angiotensin-converting enzyme-like n=1 Tax=Ischnura elegans TaxID=197161 RepID=UPI001ED8BAE3|nr:angiotensin-converting enzyme-like [Ischnura elegans]